MEKIFEVGMRYTKLILAFVIVLVIVTMVGSLKCDAFSDVNEPLVLGSSEFRVNPRGAQVETTKQKVDRWRKENDTSQTPMPTNKVRFFQDGDYKGYSRDFGIGKHDFHEYEINSYSSIKVPPGMGVKLFKKGGQADFHSDKTEDVSNLKSIGVNDDVESIEVYDGVTKADASKCTCVSPNGSEYNKYYSLNPIDPTECIRRTKDGKPGPAFAGPFTVKSVCNTSSSKSIQSVSSGTCEDPDKKKYKYRTRKKYSGGWRCPNGWEDTGCDWGMAKDREKKQCRKLKLRDSDGGRSKKGDVRKKCDKMAKKNKGVFAECKGVKGKKRDACIGRRDGPMERCLKDEHRKEAEDWGTSSETSVTLFYDANLQGHPMPFTGYASMNLSKVDRKQASSARVAKGFKALVYNQTNFKGTPLTLDAGDHNSFPAGWNDQISSIVVKKA